MSIDPSQSTEPCPDAPCRDESAGETQSGVSAGGTFRMVALEAPAAPPPGEIPEGHLSPFEPAEYAEASQPQFGLSELLIWAAMISFAFGGLHLLEPRVFAGVCGCVTLAWLMILSALKPEGRMFFVIWWALMVTYILACAIAMRNG